MLLSINTKAGKVTVVTVFFSLIAIFAVFLLDIQHGGQVQRATADVATTSVTVLNTAPSWTSLAVENLASATSSPTNVGSDVTFEAVGTDSNAEDYYLLICKVAGAPTPTEGGAPVCNGGASNMWVVSTSTTSGDTASVSYTASTTEALETYSWYAWICDDNAISAQCNATPSGEGVAANKSPFHVNHRPVFTDFWDDSPTLPSSMTTWTATSSDPDSTGGADNVVLYVCTTANFTAGVGCDDGTWATSSLSATNPVATSTISAPYQDGNYESWGFIEDEHGFASLGVSQGTNSTTTVANATPIISNVVVNSNGTSTIILTVEQGETTGFISTFDVTDDNSCVANGSTTSEILSADINVYRGDIGSTSCAVAGDYNTNYCYTGTKPTAVWNVSCSQNSGTCLGPTDDTVTWTCTYPIWYVADPTDAGVAPAQSPHAAEEWFSTALVVDDNSATSSLKEAGSGVELQQFMQFSVGTTSIVYGNFQPGQGNASTSRPTSIFATGNTGLDENLSGTDMCPTYPVCFGAATNTIPVSEQHYATSTVATSSAFTLSAVQTELEINLSQTLSTTTPSEGITYWGIFVPSAIMLSGDYIGVNTLTGKTADTADW